jgi:large subunit ribosomal protein L2
MCYLPCKKTGTLKGIIKYANGGFSCINTPLGLKIGTIIKTVVSLNYKLGKLGNITLGDTVLLFLLKQRSVFFNVTSPEQNKNTLAKSAGTYCFIIAYERSKNYTKIQMPSGNQKYIYNFTFVTVGRNSNSARRWIVVGNAGDNINSGFKSSVRGVAMNPVDHPHGGRAKTNQPEKTPWGKIAKLCK